MTKHELEQRMIAVADGDMSALHDVYEELSIPVYRCALSILHSRQSAEDAMQDTFVRARKYSASFKGGSVRAWILAITRSLCRDELARPRAASLDDAAELAADTRGEADIDSEDAAARLLSSALSPEEREIVSLRVFGGLSHRDIATALGISYAAVRWKYAYAIKKLRSALEAKGE